jgi:hypothetical protein
MTYRDFQTIKVFKSKGPDGEHGSKVVVLDLGSGSTAVPEMLALQGGGVE